MYANGRHSAFIKSILTYPDSNRYYTCPYCGQEGIYCTNFNDHLMENHGLTSEQMVLEKVHFGIRPKCANINCNNNTKWFKLFQGYQETCCKSCSAATTWQGVSDEEYTKSRMLITNGAIESDFVYVYLANFVFALKIGVCTNDDKHLYKRVTGYDYIKWEVNKKVGLSIERFILLHFNKYFPEREINGKTELLEINQKELIKSKIEELINENFSYF